MNTEQERAELLPCPFCGGDHLKLFGESAPEWWVCCETCKAATQTRTNKSQAIEDWNRRAALQHSCKETSQDREDLLKALIVAENMLCNQENALRSFGAHEPCAESAILGARAAIGHARRIGGE